MGGVLTGDPPGACDTGTLLGPAPPAAFALGAPDGDADAADWGATLEGSTAAAARRTAAAMTAGAEDTLDSGTDDGPDDCAATAIATTAATKAPAATSRLRLRGVARPASSWSLRSSSRALRG